MLGTNRTLEGIVSRLPAGRWSVSCYYIVAKAATELTSDVTGDYTFNSLGSRAAIFHFKRL